MEGMYYVTKKPIVYIKSDINYRCIISMVQNWGKYFIKAKINRFFIT